MKSLPSKYCYRSAFTLVELLITVMIMLISLTAGVINYIRFLQKQEFYQAGSYIESVLKDARSKAQNGFLGDESIGYCSKLAAAEVVITETSENKVITTARLRCADGALLNYDNLATDSGVSLDHDLTVAFFPMRGAELSLSGSTVASGSAKLIYNGDEVVFNLDQGGAIDVKYR